MLCCRGQLVDASGMGALHDVHSQRPPSLEGLPGLAALAKAYGVQPTNGKGAPAQAQSLEAESVQEWLRLRSSDFVLA